MEPSSNNNNNNNNKQEEEEEEEEVIARENTNDDDISNNSNNSNNNNNTNFTVKIEDEITEDTSYNNNNNNSNNNNNNNETDEPPTETDNNTDTDIINNVFNYEEEEIQLPAILKKNASPYITIFLGTNFVGILLWSTLQSNFPWFIFISAPVAAIECCIYGLSKKEYFFLTIATYCNVVITVFIVYLAFGGPYPWFIFPTFTLAIFPITHYLFIHCPDKKLRYFLIHIAAYALANVQIYFAWVINDSRIVTPNHVPWFIYPWGGWGLFLMVHYNYALMRNLNMLLVYMFLDAAGIVVITFRFTIGPIVLMAILVVLVLILIFQLCLKKIIMNSVYNSRQKKATERRQALQEQHIQQQVQLQQLRLQQLQQQQQLQHFQQQQHLQNYSYGMHSLYAPPPDSSFFNPSVDSSATLHSRRRRGTTKTLYNENSGSSTNNNDDNNPVFTLPPLFQTSNFQFQPPPVQPSLSSSVTSLSSSATSLSSSVTHLPSSFSPYKFVQAYPSADRTNFPAYFSQSHSHSPSPPTVAPSPRASPVPYSIPSTTSVSPPPTFIPSPPRSSIPSPPPIPAVANNRSASIPANSPQLKPKRKKLRQPDEPLELEQEGLSNDVMLYPTAKVEPPISDNKRLIAKPGKRRGTNSSTSGPTKDSPSNNNNEKSRAKSPVDSDMEDLVVVQDSEEHEQSGDDF